MNRWQKRKFWTSLDLIDRDQDRPHDNSISQTAQPQSKDALSLQLSLSSGPDSVPAADMHETVKPKVFVKQESLESIDTSAAQTHNSLDNGGLCRQTSASSVTSSQQQVSDTSTTAANKLFSGLHFLLLPHLAGSVQLGVFKRRIVALGTYLFVAVVHYSQAVKYVIR